MSFNYGDSMYNSNMSPRSMRSFERESHANSNADWDGYSFTEKVDPEDQGYANPQQSAQRAGWLLPLGALTALAALALGILTFVLHRRCSSIWTLLILFATILSVLLGLAAAYLGISLKSAIVSGRRENSNMTGFIYILSALLVPIFFTVGIYSILSKPFRFGCIQCQYPGQGQSWTGFYDNQSLAEGWSSDQNLVNWAAALCFVLATLFLLITLTVATTSKYLIEINRGLLAVAGFMVILFSLFNIYRSHQASATNKKVENSQLSEGNFLLNRYTLYIAIILALITLVFNVLKKRILYFLLGFLLLVLALIMVANTAYQMRIMRKVNNPGTLSAEDCSLNLARIHEKNIQAICSSGKYLPKGTVCRKSDDAVYWEGDGTKRALNPAACHAASTNDYFELFLAGFNSFLVFGYLCIMACCAFFLSDTSEFMEIYNKKIGMLEIIFLGLSVLMVLLAFFLIPRLTAGGTYQENDWAEKNRMARQGIDPNDPDYEIVEESVIKANNPDVITPSSDSKNFVYTKDRIPTVQCVKTAADQCYYRVAILADKATILNKPTSHDVVGTDLSRYIFYPDCDSADADFLFLRGNAEDINAAIQLLEYRPTGFEKSIVYFDIDKVKKEDLDAQGLAAGEGTEGFKNPSNNGACSAPAGFAPYDKKECVAADCNISTELNAFSKTVPVVGTIKVLKPDGKGVVPFDNKNDLDIKLLKDGSEIQGTGLVIGDGAVVGFRAPVNELGGYTIQIQMKDKKGRYLPNVIDLSIPSSPPPQLSFGNNVLILPGGRGCGGLTGDQATLCYQDNKGQKFGTLKFIVVDADTDEPVEGALVKLFHLHTVQGSSIGQDGTNASGEAEFLHMRYDYLNAQIEREGYYPSLEKVFLNIPELTQKAYLFKHDVNKMNLRMNSNNPDLETDILLDIQSKTGKTCTVSPANKYCAYSVHVKDVNKGETGYESIVVEKLTVSKYMLYSMVDDTQYNENCAAAQSSSLNYTHSAVDFSWDNMKKQAKHLASTPPKYWAIKCFTGFGLVSDKYVGHYSNTKPNISDLCDPLFPSTSEYSLQNLQEQNNEAKKKIAAGTDAATPDATPDATQPADATTTQ